MIVISKSLIERKARCGLFVSPPATEGKSKENRKGSGSILVDYGKGGRPIVIEITAPQHVSLQEINQVVANLNLPPFANEELAPLLAA